MQYGNYVQYGGQSSSIYCQKGYFLQQLDGGSISFPNVTTGCYNKDPNSGIEKPYPAADVITETDTTSSVTLDTNAMTALLADGSIVKFSVSPNTLQDRNGNIQTFPLVPVSGGNGSAETYTYQDDTGTQAIVFHYGTSPTGTPGDPSAQLAFPCDNYNTNSPTQTGAGAGTVLTAVTLPNNTAYNVEYDAYGDLTKVTYPSGGYTRYTYQTFCPLGLTILSGGSLRDYLA